jgi:hypothetical protein
MQVCARSPCRPSCSPPARLTTHRSLRRRGRRPEVPPCRECRAGRSRGRRTEPGTRCFREQVSNPHRPTPLLARKAGRGPRFACLSRRTGNRFAGCCRGRSGAAPGCRPMPNVCMGTAAGVSGHAYVDRDCSFAKNASARIWKRTDGRDSCFVANPAAALKLPVRATTVDVTSERETAVFPRRFRSPRERPAAAQSETRLALGQMGAAEQQRDP